MSGIQPAQVSELQNKARKGLQRSLNYMFANADQALQSLAGRARSNAEQNLYFESMRELRFKRRGIENFFVDAVGQSFSRLLSQGRVDQKSTVLEAEADLDSLTLVREDTLEDELTTETMAGRAVAANSKILDAVSGRLAAILGLKRLEVEDNPLGPHVLCGAFLKVLRELEIQNQTKRVFSKLFERYVLGDLEKFYTELMENLPQPDEVASAQAPESKADAKAAGSSEKEPAGSKSVKDAGWDTSLTPLLVPAGKAPAMPVAVFNELFESLQTDLAESDLEHPLLQPDFAADALPIHQMLNELLDREGYSRPMALPFAQAQTMIVVGKLFQHLVSDSRIPGPVKPLLKLMQVPVLRVALKDKDLIDRPNHSVRQLLNELTGACIGWTLDSDPGEDPLYKKLAETARALVKEFNGEIDVFEDALLEFQGWRKAEQGITKLVEQRTIDAESGRADSEAARLRVHGLIADEMSGFVIPQPLKVILTGPWSDVLYLILLQEGEDSDSWIAAETTTVDLVQSVQPIESDEDRGLVQESASRSIRALRRGLERLQGAQEKWRAEIDALEKLQLELLGDAAAGDAAATKPDVIAFGEIVDDETLVQVDALTPDSWVDFRRGKYTGSARLLTRIPATGKLIFVNRLGAKVGEWEREEFASAVAKGDAALLGGTRLFDQAVRSLNSGEN